MSIIDKLSGGIAQAAAGAFNKRTERKIQQDALKGKLAEKRIDSETQIELSEKEWELLSKKAEESTWKDEYAVVSVISILNLIVLGGIASAFGYPQILDGIRVAIVELNTALNGTELGGIMKVTIYAALGIYGINRIFTR